MYMYCIYKHIDESNRELTAFKILADVMNTTKKSSLGYVYLEYEVCLYACRRLHMTCNFTSFSFQTMDDICKEPPARSSPRIAALVGESTSVQYFVIVEPSVLCELPSFKVALYIMFCTYYVFKLAYPRQSKNTLQFCRTLFSSHLTP